MKVIFLTNVIRRMGMMQQTMEKLQQEGKLDNACACRWITDATVWDDKWHKELAGSKLVIMKWMGTGLDTISCTEGTSSSLCSSLSSVREKSISSSRLRLILPRIKPDKVISFRRVTT